MGLFSNMYEFYGLEFFLGIIINSLVRTIAHLLSHTQARSLTDKTVVDLI